MRASRETAGPKRTMIGSARIAVWSLVGLITALSTLGMAALASAGTVRGEARFGDPLFFIKRQLIWLGFGVIAARLAADWNYRRWRDAAPWVCLLSIVLLVLVLVIGRKINGCHRWLALGPISFQPSELAKFMVIVMLACWFSRLQVRSMDFKEGLLVPAMGLGFVLILVLLEPDFGSTALIAAVGCIMLFLGGANQRWLLGAALAGAALLFLYVRFNPHRWELVMAWWDPEGHPELAYHYLQAKTAYERGGATGVGYLGSVTKHLYLPEAHTDFILPVLAEELGLAGTLSILMLFAGLTVCGLVISMQVPDRFGRFLGLGITMLITLQALFNICVVTGLLPTKGLALPFFSYGGSNLFMTLLQCGILINMGLQVADSEDCD